MKKVSFFVSFIICLVLITAPAFGDSVKKSNGQTLYVPALHNCFRWSDNGSCLNIGDTRLILRNVDLGDAIAITSISIYGPDGEHLYEYIEESPLIISPLSSKTFLFQKYIPLWDASDAARPSFIVKWEATKKGVIPPIVESARVFVNILGNGQIGFGGVNLTPGTVLKE